MTEVRDEFGMTKRDWSDLRKEQRKWNRVERWRALKALWMPPVTSTGYRGRTSVHDGRGEEWTIVTALCATIAIILNRHWTDDAERRHRAKRGRFICGRDMAFWDARDVYGGYEIMRAWLYPGFRISIFSDGECLM